MKKKWFILTLVFLTVVNLSALGTFVYQRWCCTEPACAMDSTEDHGCYMRKHFDITEDQINRLNAVENSSRPLIQALTIQMKERRIELMKTLMDKNSDNAKIEAALRQIDSLQATMQRQIVKRLLDEKGILIPQQQEKFFSLVLGRFCMEMDSIKKTQCQNNKSQ